MYICFLQSTTMPLAGPVFSLCPVITHKKREHLLEPASKHSCVPLAGIRSQHDRAILAAFCLPIKCFSLMVGALKAIHKKLSVIDLLIRKNVFPDSNR
jgi:hypothetical protein